MPLRYVIHVPKNVIRIAGYVALAVVVLFFTVTRTQVGRDALKEQAEQQFHQRFGGDLSIGRLTGNLAHTLYASDVVARDDAGRAILSIDSLVLRPSWHDLLSRTFSSGTVTLIRPRLHVHRAADGTWDVARILRRDRVTVQGLRWSFSAANVRIVDGAVTTTYDGPPPPLVARGTLFDYADASVHGIEARAVVDWRPQTKVVDLLSFSADGPVPGFAVDEIQGQVVLDGGGATLNALTVRSGRTDVRLTASVDSLAALLDGDRRRATVDLDLAPGTVDFDALRRLVPGAPLRGLLAVEARLHGPPAHLTIDRLCLGRGSILLAAEGTVNATADSLGFDLSFPDNTLTDADLRAVWPAAPLPPFAHLDTVRVSLHATGAVALLPSPAASFRTDNRFSLRSSKGSVSGHAAVRGAGRRVAYQFDVDAQSLDVGGVIRRAEYASDLNGRIVGAGSGVELKALHGRIEMGLRRSSFAQRRADSTHVVVQADSGRYRLRLAVRDRGGLLQADATIDDVGGPPAYQLDLSTRRFDLGPLVRDDSLHTRLDGKLSLRGSGVTLADVNGRATITLDSSVVQSGIRRQDVPPQQATLTLIQGGADGGHVVVEGDALTARLDGDVELPALVALGRRWRNALTQTATDQLAKPRTPVPPGSGATDVLRGPPSGPSAVAAAGTASSASVPAQSLATGTVGTVRLDGSVDLHHAALLYALMPGIAPLTAGAKTSFHISADDETFTLETTTAADSLRLGRFAADSLGAHFTVTGRMVAPSTVSLRSHLTTRGRHISFAGQDVTTGHLNFDFEHDTGNIRLFAGGDSTDAPLQLSARLDLLPDRNRLTLTDFLLIQGHSAWVNPGESHVDLFAGAAVVPGLVLENVAGTSPVQRFRLEGALSNEPTDTLTVALEEVQLRPLSDLAAMRKPVGGVLNGRVAFTGFTRRPELTGALDVRTFSLDDRILGRLSASSRYLPGQPDVALDVFLAPSAADSLLLSLPGTDVPATREENRLHVGGTFRLPTAHAAGTLADAGTLHLTADIERADMFFFDYIFSDDLANTEGYASGTGHITGTLDHPLFDANLHVYEGHFDVPQFGLSYGIDGDVTIDREGIKLSDVTLRDATGGRGNVDGAILFNDYRYFSFDLHGALRDIQIMNVRALRPDLPFYGQIWASGSLSLTGPLYSATLRTTDAVTRSDSEIFIPLTESTASSDQTFIVFADSTGQLPDLNRRSRRPNLLAQRPEGERPFVDGLEMDLNFFAPQGSTVHLVIDPLLGDVINAVGTGRIQLQRAEGEFSTFGSLDVTSGDYLFTAGEVFYRRFVIDDGRITWDGDPLNASLDIDASYRTRASTAGLNLGTQSALIPLVVQMHVTGRVASPVVDLSLAVEHDERSPIGNYEGIEAQLNQPERAAEYATSVLLTNSFLLTTSSTDTQLTVSGNQLAFNSLSQLVASQLNRYLGEALPNVDLSLGFQGENTQDLDVTYGVALRLLDERLIIRGQGIYANNPDARATQQSLLDEFVVQVRLNPKVSVEVFYRREGDVLNAEPFSNTTGAGLSYQTQFTTWQHLLHRLFGWMLPKDADGDDGETAEPVATEQE